MPLVISHNHFVRPAISRRLIKDQNKLQRHPFKIQESKVTHGSHVTCSDFISSVHLAQALLEELITSPRKDFSFLEQVKATALVICEEVDSSKPPKHFEGDLFRPSQSPARYSAQHKIKISSLNNLCPLWNTEHWVEVGIKVFRSIEICKCISICYTQVE